MNAPSTIQARLLALSIPVPEAGCWLWTGSLSKSGYGHFTVAGRHTRRAHRVSYAAFKGEIPEGMLVCHRCDTPSCINPDHLFLGTPKENICDAARKGRLKPPPSSGRLQPGRGNSPIANKLTPDDVRVIRALKGCGLTMTEIGRRFGVSRTAISSIWNGRCWGWVDSTKPRELRTAQGFAA